MTGTAQRPGRPADHRRPRRRRAAPKRSPWTALRRLRPAHPRPGRTGWRRRLPSWRQLLGGFAASIGLHTEPYSVRRITRNGAAVRPTTPTTYRAIGAEVAEQVSEALADSLSAAHPGVSTATGKSGTTADDTAARYTGTAQSVSTAVVVHRMDLAASLDPLPPKGIAGTPAESVPYAVRSGAMGLD